MARHVFFTNPHGSMEVSFTGSKRHAEASMRKLLKRLKRRSNVEQGFYDRKGRFHPIRASSDYSGSRAGEGRKRSKKARRRKRR